MEPSLSYRHPMTLAQASNGKTRVKLVPDADARLGIARDLQIEGLLRLSADLSVRPWLDGVEISGGFEARVAQICGVSLEVFEQDLSGEIELRVVPKGSPNTPLELEGGEIELDPEAPDPPDVLDGDVMDLGAYLVEHLALAIDPFPRKPGVVFDYAPDKQEESPFAVLKRLTDKPQ
jgi:hypothetical protein